MPHSDIERPLSLRLEFVQSGVEVVTDTLEAKVREGATLMAW